MDSRDQNSERHRRPRRRHSFCGTLLAVVGLMALLLILARYVVIPVLVMLGGAAT